MSPDDGRDSEDRAPRRPGETKESGDGPAMSPEDLDFEDEEEVVSLDEGRYVIGTDARPDVSDEGDGSTEESSEASGSAEGTDDSDGGAAVTDADSGGVKQRLEDDLEGTSARYGFHVSAKSDDAISHQQMFSDDVGTVFDSLLRWYAQQLTTETAVEDVLGILLTESNVRVRYSPSCLQAILEAYDLGPDDTIADLFEAVQNDRGMVFPPENV